MQSIRSLSIRDKILRMIMLTCGSGLLLFAAVVEIRDLIMEPAAIRERMSVIAEMVATTIAPAH